MPGAIPKAGQCGGGLPPLPVSIGPIPQSTQMVHLSGQQATHAALSDSGTDERTPDLRHSNNVRLHGAWPVCRFQSDKCSRTTGSCLDNQIFHLKQKDEARMASGLLPQFLLSRYLRGGSNTLRINGSAEQAMDRVQLELPVDQISTSIITLEVVADSFTFVENSSPGEVRSYCAHIFCHGLRVCTSLLPWLVEVQTFAAMAWRVGAWEGEQTQQFQKLHTI